MPPSTHRTNLYLIQPVHWPISNPPCFLIFNFQMTQNAPGSHDVTAPEIFELDSALLSTLPSDPSSRPAWTPAAAVLPDTRMGGVNRTGGNRSPRYWLSSLLAISVGLPQAGCIYHLMILDIWNSSGTQLVASGFH